MDKLDLKDIKIRNFWNSCPKKLDALPCESCDLGKKSVTFKPESSPPCEWWVNSEKHHYCFWRYLNAVSLTDGKSDPLLQNEIAELLNCSSTKIHFILKAAVEKLKVSQFLDILQDYYGSSANAELESDLPPDIFSRSEDDE